MSFLLGLISFILVVFPIIVLHEFGHFIIGKWLGAEPEEFSIGFGKKIFNFQWLGANFKLSWIPLGGYVKFKKMQFDIEAGEPGKVGEKIDAWRWIFISIAGPLTNFILTFLLFFVFMFSAFNSREKIAITQIKNDSLSSVKVGAINKTLKVGDKFLIFKENNSITNFFKKNIIKAKSSGLIFMASEKNYEEVFLTKEELLSRVEVSYIDNSILFGTIESIKQSATFIKSSFIGTTMGLASLITDKNGFKGMMGPVGIASEADKARNNGFFDFILLMAAISFAVGYFNLLPLTFLDGGRAVLAFLETIFKKPISNTLLGTLNIAGFIFIIFLFVVSNLSDFLRMTNKEDVPKTKVESSVK